MVDQRRYSHFFSLCCGRSSRCKHLRGDFFTAGTDRDGNRAGGSAQALAGTGGPWEGFVLCAQLPMDQSGKCFAYENGKLVNELAAGKDEGGLRLSEGVSQEEEAIDENH